jgi:hypothetical protein
MKKQSFIRSDKLEHKSKCPFGLPITDACHHAGDSVSRMCPLEMLESEKVDLVKKTNSRVYIYYKNGQRCIYAKNIMEDHDNVNCDFGDTAQGMNTPAISGSPIYAQTFAGVGLDGLYAFPLGFYADNNESRNLSQGLFSLVGGKAFDIIKTAVLDEESMKDIVKKLEDGGELNTEDMTRLETALESCRSDFEKSSTTSAKHVELDQMWNSRKRL